MLRAGIGFLLPVVLLYASPALQAQELEPRAYSASPVGTNFLAVGLGRAEGGVLVDPSLPVTDVEATIDSALLGYARTFGVLGRGASGSVLLPYVWADVSGNVGETRGEVRRSGIGDARLRLAVDLVGNPALTPRAFAQRKPTTIVGTSLTVVAPTGQYDGARLINIGTNRWAFKPEIGISQPLGSWFFEAMAGVWLFTDNSEFFGGHRRSQDPLASYQLHVGYTFRPGLWLAGDATYYTGGGTRVDGIAKQDKQENSRYGLTLSLPLRRGLSLKLAWSQGWSTRIGGNFDSYTAALQYRWFDR